MEGKYESQARVVELATLLKTRAPSVAPNVAPRPYKHATSNILTLCTTPKQRADAEAYLAAAVEREERVQGEGGSRPEEQEENEAKHVVVTSETDIGTRTFRITAAKVRMDEGEMQVLRCHCKCLPLLVGYRRYLSHKIARRA